MLHLFTLRLYTFHEMILHEMESARSVVAFADFVGQLQGLFELAACGVANQTVTTQTQIYPVLKSKRETDTNANVKFHFGI